MVWPFLMGSAAALTAVAWSVENGHALRCSAAIFAGFVAVRAVLMLPVSVQYEVLLISAVWVAVSGAIQRQVVACGGKVPTFVIIAAILVALNAATGLWARVSEAPRVVGSLPYMAGDILLILAMLLTGWSMRHDVISRVREGLDRGRVVGADAGGVRGGLSGFRSGGFDPKKSEEPKGV